jgi:hypothetical protein
MKGLLILLNMNYWRNLKIKKIFGYTDFAIAVSNKKP